MYAEIFRSRLKQLRETKGYKQIDLSEELGINRVTYTNYELGKRQPDIDTIAKIANLYNVTIDWLVGRDQPQRFN